MNKNIIKIDKVQITGDRVEYFLDVQGEVKKYFNFNENMFVEYGENIESVPEGIAIIPLITNILPIAWFSDAEIVVNEIDKAFYECIEEIKKGYTAMHKFAVLKGKFSANKIIYYRYTPEEKSAAFFSGGVDSLATLISRLDEKPTLVTLWGSDINLDDREGWKRVKNEVVDFGKKRGLNNLLIKSSFRRFIKEEELDRSFYKLMNDNWWHGAQHGIGLIGHIAPYAYIHKLKVVYIPATLTPENSDCSCASHPNIDNKVRIASCKTVHEGFENTRQDKIKIICDYIKKSGDKFIIRVCWQSKGGQNCSVCEKCSRTIMGLIAEKVDPNKYGFNVTDRTILNIKRRWKYVWSMGIDRELAWVSLQNRFKEDKEFWKNSDVLKWILKIDFIKQSRKNKSFFGKIKRKIYLKLTEGGRH